MTANKIIKDNPIWANINSDSKLIIEDLKRVHDHMNTKQWEDEYYCKFEVEKPKFLNGYWIL